MSEVNGPLMRDCLLCVFSGEAIVYTLRVVTFYDSPAKSLLVQSDFSHRYLRKETSYKIFLRSTTISALDNSIFCFSDISLKNTSAI